MKTIYDYAIEAFTLGSDNFGERPTTNAREKYTFYYVPFSGVPHYRVSIPMEQCSDDGEISYCRTGIGIYPYTEKGQKRIYFYSGHRVFDIEVTPEIQDEFNGVSIPRVDTKSYVSKLEAKSKSLEENNKILEENNKKLERKIREIETRPLIESLEYDIAYHEFYIEMGHYPNQKPPC